MGRRYVFRTEAWKRSLASYGAATHLTVVLVGPDGEWLLDPFVATPMFDLLAGSGRDPGLVEACARRCMGEKGLGPPVIEERYGLAAVGTPLTLAGETLGAAVAAYVVTSFPDQHVAQRLAAAGGVPVAELWATLRRQLPLAHERVLVYGELLQTLCAALLSEHHRTQQLEEASAQLMVEAKAKDRFLAVLSHELRTPLTAMLGWTRMLRSGRLSAAASDRALDVIERNTKAQADLIEDLLHVSRIVAGKVVLDHQPLRLAPIIDGIVDTLRPSAEAKGVQVDAVLDPAAGVVSVDPARIGQVISNLVSNAIKFTPAGGRVEVRLAQCDHEVQVTVTDTGVGITPEALPFVFDRFSQADTTATRAYAGLGLGLTIVRHLVELHGGTVEAASAGAGRGATFTVRLTALEGVEPLPEQRFAPGGGRSAGTDDVSGLEGLRVLIVDDDPDAHALFTAILEQHKIEVVSVASVSEALAVFERRGPDVLISDIGLPGESGYDLIRKVRQLPQDRGRDTPALALTAYAHPEDKRLALAAGFQLHVAKPVDAVALVLAVARLAGRQ